MTGYKFEFSFKNGTVKSVRAQLDRKDVEITADLIYNGMRSSAVGDILKLHHMGSIIHFIRLSEVENVVIHGDDKGANNE
tara:strand:+ start:602 stop:841 length:240 start_codon:yes stop_codon:yes gene_type:complete